MLPFPQLIQYGNTIERNVVLDIDFGLQSVGDQNIIDHTGNTIFNFITGNPGTVEYNADIDSNVMKFNNGRYQSLMNEFLSLSGKNIEIHLVLNNNNAAVGEIFCSGDYNGSRIPGINLSNNPNNNAYQMFMDNGNTFYALIFGSVQNTGWDTIIFKVDGTNIITTVNGFEQTFSMFTFGNGTNFAIGGSYTGGTPVYWNGYLKSLKIINLD